MACSWPRCSEKHGREMKMKDLNPAEAAEEGDFPASFDD